MFLNIEDIYQMNLPIYFTLFCHMLNVLDLAHALLHLFAQALDLVHDLGVSRQGHGSISDWGITCWRGISSYYKEKQVQLQLNM